MKTNADALVCPFCGTDVTQAGAWYWCFNDDCGATSSITPVSRREFEAEQEAHTTEEVIE